MITPSLLGGDTNIYKSNSFLHLPNTLSNFFIAAFFLFSDEINTLYQVQLLYLYKLYLYCACHYFLINFMK